MIVQEIYDTLRTARIEAELTSDASLLIGKKLVEETIVDGRSYLKIQEAGCMLLGLFFIHEDGRIGIPNRYSPSDRMDMDCLFEFSG
jgi:hypothetical protein